MVESPLESTVGLDTDVLFVAFNRPEYTKKSLPALLDSAREGVRVWIWQNGPDPATLEVVRRYRDHPSVHRYHESPENMGLYPALQWVLTEGQGQYVSKVDDDCLLPLDWIARLTDLHARNPEVGVLGCWRFQEEDFDEALAAKKLREIHGAHLLENLWVEGSGFLLKRSALEQVGGLRSKEWMPSLFKRVARAGYRNGWVYPFINQDHMDDPRSPNTQLRCDADLEGALPISAKVTGVRTLADWDAQLRNSARFVQSASTDLRDYFGFVPTLRGWWRAVKLWCRRQSL